MCKLVLALFVVAIGCNKHPGSQRLEGRWRGQKADGVAADAQDRANTFAQATEIVAQGNQITIKTPAGPQSATYSVDREEPTTVVIHTDKDEATETFLFSAAGDTMTWKIDPQRSITFRKVP